ncbi:MAG: 30S ribosomal protein S7 [Candidatus Omnitrophica bacterium]|nr:30S ribosomal protein S7 [Candidatus Omnitrophota bacterium]
MRRRRAPKREVLPDPKYNSKLVSKFMNIVMLEGKKSVAEKIVYGAFEQLKKKAQKDDALDVFQKAIENARPKVELKPRRVGGATYQIPIEVDVERGTTIALRWLRDFARAKKGRPMEEKLSDEIMQAYQNQGSAIKKKQDTHKMAEANRAFAHFKW